MIPLLAIIRTQLLSYKNKVQKEEGRTGVSVTAQQHVNKQYRVCLYYTPCMVLGYIYYKSSSSTKSKVGFCTSASPAAFFPQPWTDIQWSVWSDSDRDDYNIVKRNYQGIQGWHGHNIYNYSQEWGDLHHPCISSCHPYHSDYHHWFVTYYSSLSNSWYLWDRRIIHGVVIYI